jgi:parallel beta-helix repeat protein
MLGGKNVDFVGNTTVNNTEYGIARFDSLGGTMRDNRASGSEEAGIYLGDSPDADASIVDNVAWNNGFFGFLVRDSSLGKVVNNIADNNCVGIMVVSTYTSTDNWTVKDNVARNNTKACPGVEGEFPAVSGVGIFLVGASHNKVVENMVTGNRATGPTVASGGIAIVTAKRLGDISPAGNDPVGNLIKENTARNNQPDLYYDGTGSGNRFVDNSCRTSTPADLCKSDR